MITFFCALRALDTGLATCFFCPLMPVFFGLGTILSLNAAGLGLAGFTVVAAFFFSDGFALDLVLRAAALAEPGFAVGADAGFFSAVLGAAAAAGLAAAGLAAAGAGLAVAALGAAAFGAGAGVLALAGFGAALVAEAALGAGAGVLDVAGFFSGLDPVDPDAKREVNGIR